VYEILDKLISKGVVSYVIREKTKYFQAASPNRILDYVNSKEQELSSKKTEITKLIPQLEKIKETTINSQSAQVFEGVEGMKTVFGMILQTLKPGDEYYGFSMGEELKEEWMKTFLLNYHQKRAKRKINVKLIFQSSQRKISKDIANIKGVNAHYYNYPFPIGLIIFKDYVATFTFKEKPTIFLIKSEQNADSHYNYFEHLWKISKK
jgi:HTH-type transcriptional regulator, sugar sensing transcriptional regulator